MISADDAIRIAQEHIALQPQPHLDYRIGLGAGREILIGWYFDYAIECLKDTLAHEHEQFAGAPGFVVSRDDGRVEVIDWGQYKDMGLAND